MHKVQKENMKTIKMEEKAARKTRTQIGQTEEH
jgi:hypothetical protein